MSYADTANVLSDIAKERDHQRELGWTNEHDDEHVNLEISKGATNILLDAFGLPAEFIGLTPDWYGFYDKYDYERHILVATSLLVAELERLKRDRKNL